MSGKKVSMREALMGCIVQMCSRCRELASKLSLPSSCFYRCGVKERAQAALEMPVTKMERYGESADKLWGAYLNEATSDMNKHENKDFIKWLLSDAEEA